MKKILSLLLCVAMCCVLLVGCAEDEIGAYLDDYDDYRTQDDRAPMVLDFYIITEMSGSDEAAVGLAKTTVTNAINTYLSSRYKTELDIHFLTEAEYSEKVMAAVDEAGAERADIVLVNSKAMFDSLNAEDKLVALNRYFSSKAFGRLNSPEVIAAALLDGIEVEEAVLEDGQTVNKTIRYVVPNNRVTGSYEYYMVHKEIARYFYYSDLDFKNMEYGSDSFNAFKAAYEPLVADNLAALEAAGLTDDAYLTHEDIGTDYHDRLEYLDDYVCIASEPVVTSEEAHESSFAIIAQDGTDEANLHHAERCMEVIYALNTDEEFKNLLQYGVRNTHYLQEEVYVDEFGAIVEDGTQGASRVILVEKLDGSVYAMNNEYTGSIFNAHYTKDGSWSPSIAYSGKIQNQSVSLAE